MATMADGEYRSYRQRDSDALFHPRSPARSYATTNIDSLGAEEAAFARKHPQAMAQAPCLFCCGNRFSAHEATGHCFADCANFSRFGSDFRKDFLRQHDTIVVSDEAEPEIKEELSVEPLSIKDAEPQVKEELPDETLNIQSAPVTTGVAKSAAAQSAAAQSAAAQSAAAQSELAEIMAMQPCPWCKTQKIGNKGKKRVPHKVAAAHSLAGCSKFGSRKNAVRQKFLNKMRNKLSNEKAAKKKKTASETKKMKDKTRLEIAAKIQDRTPTPYPLRSSMPMVDETNDGEGGDSEEGGGAAVANVEDLRHTLESLSNTIPGHSRLQVATALRARWQQEIFKMQAAASNGWLGGVPPLEAIMLEALQLWIEKEEASGGV